MPLLYSEWLLRLSLGGLFLGVHMKKVVKGQTGPTSEIGKKISSKNAQKAGIFTEGYLPSEDVDAKHAQFEALAQQWGVKDPSRLMFLRTIEQAYLGIERQMQAERNIIEGAMQSLDIANAFAKAAGLNPLLAMNMPSWYFDSEASEIKEYAVLLHKAHRELKTLQANFSDQLAAQIAQQYPTAYAYIMEGQRQSASFLSVLGERYRLATPILNLGAAASEIADDYRDHLIWAQDPERYELIIAGLRSAKARELIDWDKSNRYAVSLQNRLLKGFQGLALMDQHEQLSKTLTLPLAAKSTQNVQIAMEGDGAAESS